MEGMEHLATIAVGEARLDQVDQVWYHGLDMGERYSIYEAKTHFSEIIRQVKRRRSVVITDRGREVAQVVGIHRAGGLDERLETLKEAGIVSKPVAPGRPGDLRPIARKPGALKRFLAERNRF